MKNLTENFSSATEDHCPVNHLWNLPKILRKPCKQTNKSRKNNLPCFWRRRKIGCLSYRQLEFKAWISEFMMSLNMMKLMMKRKIKQQ